MDDGSTSSMNSSRRVSFAGKRPSFPSATIEAASGLQLNIKIPHAHKIVKTSRVRLNRVAEPLPKIRPKPAKRMMGIMQLPNLGLYPLLRLGPRSPVVFADTLDVQPTSPTPSEGKNRFKRRNKSVVPNLSSSGKSGLEQSINTNSGYKDENQTNKSAYLDLSKLQDVLEDHHTSQE